MYAAALLVLGICQNLAAAPPARDANAVRQAVSGHFAELKGYEPSDLIRRADFDQIIADLKKKDVEVDRFAPLRERIPADNSSIAKLNRTKKGKRFLRQAAKIPGGYAQVERLYEAPNGRSTMRVLVNARGGDQMIEYLADTTAGRRMEALIPPPTRKQREEAPTIFTAADLASAMLAALTAPPQEEGQKP